MIKFTKDIVLSLYKKLVDKTGGTFGVRDLSMLESAIEAPYQTFGGVELYPTMIEKAARLGFGLVSNHPFIDGNKRIGIFIMLIFLKVNDIDIKFTDDEIVYLALGVASGKLSYEDLLDFLKNK